MWNHFFAVALVFVADAQEHLNKLNVFFSNSHSQNRLMARVARKKVGNSEVFKLSTKEPGALSMKKMFFSGLS